MVIGVANGCFDGLHGGHRRLLLCAAKACDYLIVLINTDESVKRLKGPSRPIYPLEKRIEDIKNYLSAYPHAIIPFGDTAPLDDPEPLIRVISPHVLVKGSDYTFNQIKGAEYVDSMGGRVIIVDRVEGLSTSEIYNND